MCMRVLFVILSTEVIEADVCVIDAQRVEQVEDGLRHHRRNVLPLKREEWPPPRRVILDILGSVMLLEVGVAHDRSVISASTTSSAPWSINPSKPNRITNERLNRTKIR